jgi:hypothetical protein
MHQYSAFIMSDLVESHIYGANLLVVLSGLGKPPGQCLSRGGIGRD